MEREAEREGKIIILVTRLLKQYKPLNENALSSPEASYFFIRAGKWGEVKSKRAERRENRNESARGTLGISRRPPRSPYFCIFRVFLPSPTEGASAMESDENGFHSTE